VQSVTAVNFGAELDTIGSLLPSYPYIVVDTEYPGTVHRPPAGTREGDLTSDDRYALVKANVDELPMVQLGLTLCDAQGNLPIVFVDCNIDCPVPMERAWEINFSDFDVHRDRHAAQSVEFLRSQGIDFDRARACGVSSAAFKDKLVEVLAAPRGDDELTWVTFGGAYDLAYLVKMLSDGQPLPETRKEFMDRVRALLGVRVFDAKYMAENCGRADLRGVGLRAVAANLGMPRPIVEPSFLAGPKSLTACRIHTIMRMHVLSQEDVAACQGIVDGLQ
jgi:CCR4-NOT transcription complex subunit 7/8